MYECPYEYKRTHTLIHTHTPVNNACSTTNIFDSFVNSKFFFECVSTALLSVVAITVFIFVVIVLLFFSFLG